MAFRYAYPTAWPILAWRHYEDARGAPVRDAAVESAALAAGPTLERRIAARAVAFAGQYGLDREFSRHARLLRRTAALAALAGALLGIGAARLIPDGATARANLFDMLGALLAPNLIALVLWLILQTVAMLRGRGAAGSWLGAVLHQLIERVSGVRAARDDVARAVQRGLIEYYADSVAGRARLALLSHLFWLALALGAVLGCWWLLSLRQVDFYWGSTLLGPETMMRVLEAIARPVAWLGFEIPTAADVAASRVDQTLLDPALRARWGWFLIAALLTFGVLPRVLALVACAVLVAWGDRRYTPDLALPGYWRLRPLLIPAVAIARVIDPDQSPMTRARVVSPTATPSDAPPPGAAWLALERSLPVPSGAVDLGTSVDRGDQERVLQALAADPAWPALVVHAPLAATPDRGVAHFVAALVSAARRPVYLRITETAGHELPAAEGAARIEDWCSLAFTAGIPPGRVSRVSA